MRQAFLKKLDYFFVLRPMLFFPGWSTLLAGYFILDKQVLIFNLSRIQALPLSEIALLLLLSAAAMGASFLLNQLKDIESDRENNKLFFLAEGHIGKKMVIAETLLLIVMALLLALLFSVTMALLAAGFIVLTGYLYNFNPFALKDAPLSSLIANSLMGWFAFALGWAAVHTPGWDMVLEALPYLFLNTALYFFTLLPDMEGDRKSGKNTIAVLYGMKRTIRMAFILFISSAAAAVVLKDWMILFVLTLSAPFFISTVRNYSLNSTVRTTKFVILFFAAAICFKIPFFFILMLSGFFGTRWYFKKRFNYDYPNFKG